MFKTFRNQVKITLIFNFLFKKGDILTLNLLIEHTVNTLILLTNQREIIFHLLTLGSVLFGLSFPRLFHFVIDLCKFKYLNFLKRKKIILLISILGSIFHTYNILDDAINSDLIPEYSSNFDFLEPNKHIPILIFCVQHGVNLDGPTITGRELDKRASYIKNNYVFQKISYFDYQYKERIWYPNETNPENMKIDYFFLNKYKCFQIIYRLKSQNLYSTYLYNILKITMNSTLDDYLFSYRTNNSYNLVDYFKLQKNLSYYCNWDFIVEEIHDRFQALRNPLLLFQKSFKKFEVRNYIYELKKEFKDTYEYGTTLVPLFKEDFDLEIRNDLFEDLIKYEVEPRELKMLKNVDYRRSYFNLLLTYNKEPEDDSLYIKKIFFYGDLKMTNKDDWLGLLVNILNCLSIWFNLSLIDLAYAFGSLNLYLKQLLIAKIYKIKNEEKQDYLILKKSNEKTKIILIEKNEIYYLKK